MVTEIKIRQDTTENWVAINPILADGELGYDTTVLRFKVGNGVAKWTELSYTKSDMYNDSLINEKINQINEDLSQKSNSTDVYTKQQIEDMLFVTADELFAKNYMEKNEALDKFVSKQDVLLPDFYGYVPTERTINGKELSEDIVLDYTDVQALSDTTYIPQKMSDLDNDIGYTTQLDVMQAIASIPQFKLQIVDSLSRDDAESMVLYLVPKGGSAPDVYDEYIWLEETGNFEFLGSTSVDLTGYVKNTDYASSKAAGLIKGYVANAFSFVPNSGQPYCENKSLASYNAAGGNLFIGKGTLENIKYSYVRDGIAKNTYSLSDSEKEKVRNWIGAGIPTVFETMPNIYASVGKTYQYVGETTEEFTSGYFYKAVSQGVSYIASDSNLTFDFDLFWSELASAGITLETLQMTEIDKERGGFSIIGTVESETNYRLQDINGIPLDVLLTQSIRSTSEYVGMSNRWYYKPAETFAWERVDVQPSAKTVPITQADYDALVTKDPNTLYLIEE